MLDIFGLLLAFSILGSFAAEIPECSRSPPFVNPHLCCKDPPASDVADKCSKKFGNLLEDRAPGMEQADINKTTCFAECMMSESNYLLKDGKLDMPTIEADLRTKFANDPVYIPVVIAAYIKCEPLAQRRMVAMQESPFGKTANLSCSPLSGLILGCASKELFENCPASKWTSNPQCNAFQDYMKKCTQS